MQSALTMLTSRSARHGIALGVLATLVLITGCDGDVRDAPDAGPPDAGDPVTPIDAREGPDATPVYGVAGELTGNPGTVGAGSVQVQGAFEASVRACSGRACVEGRLVP